MCARLLKGCMRDRWVRGRSKGNLRDVCRRGRELFHDEMKSKFQ